MFWKDDCKFVIFYCRIDFYDVYIVVSDLSWVYKFVHFYIDSFSY